MILLSIVQFAPILVPSKMYEFFIVVPGPILQLGPRTEEMMETFSAMVV